MNLQELKNYAKTYPLIASLLTSEKIMLVYPRKKVEWLDVSIAAIRSKISIDKDGLIWNRYDLFQDEVIMRDSNVFHSTLLNEEMKEVFKKSTGPLNISIALSVHL